MSPDPSPPKSTWTERAAPRWATNASVSVPPPKSTEKTGASPGTSPSKPVECSSANGPASRSAWKPSRQPNRKPVTADPRVPPLEDQLVLDGAAQTGFQLVQCETDT